MELRETLRVVRRNWIVAAIIVIAAAVGGWFVASATPPVYESSTTLGFEVATAGGTVQEEVQGNNLLIQQLPTYARLATTGTVLDPVIESLGLDADAAELADDLVISASDGTAFLSITASADTAADSAALATAVGDQLITEVAADQVTGPEGQTIGVSASVADPAVEPEVPTSPVTVLFVAVGLALGLVVAFIVVVLREVLNRRIRNVRDARAPGLPKLLGVVPKQRALAKGVLAGLSESPVVSDAFQRVRVALTPGLTPALPSTPVVVVVVGVGPRAGATTVATGLAAAAADAGRRVALVDPEARAAVAAGGESDAIAAGELAGTAKAPAAAEAATELAPGLVLVRTAPSGGGSEATAAARLAAALDSIAVDAELVVIDGGAISTSAEPLLLAPLASAYVIVARAGRTGADDLAAAAASISGAGASVAGAVLNAVPTRGPDSGV